MATVNYEVCDRCGNKINYHSRLLARIHTVKIKWIVCGEMMDSEKQLCKECSKELDKWLYAKKDGLNPEIVIFDEMHNYPEPGRSR